VADSGVQCRCVCVCVCGSRGRSVQGRRRWRWVRGASQKANSGEADERAAGGLAQAAVHVGTRDARAITSHAQKWFIKMCLQVFVSTPRHIPSSVASSREAGREAVGNQQDSLVLRSSSDMDALHREQKGCVELETRARKPTHWV